jgi:hypothetical protein
MNVGRAAFTSDIQVELG